MKQFTATTPIAHNFSEVAAIKEPVSIEERDDVTVDELEQIWESLPFPAELYNGRIVYKMANFAHGIIRTNVAGVIGDYLDNHPIGLVVLGVNFRLGDNRSKESRIPDVCFISEERVPKDQWRFPAMSPDLAVEIISDDDSHKKIMANVKLYLQHSAKMVWVIFAYTHEVLVCTAKDKHYVRDLLTAPEVLPEFELPVRKIFEGIEE